MNRVPPPELLPGSGVDAENPWPGLVSFTEALQGFFHGRSDETDELLRRVERKNLTVLFGQSGLGKSSLLQAGLFPRLRADGYLPVPVRLDHAADAPALGEQLKTAAARAILDAGGLSESAASDAGESLWEHFHRRSLSLESGDGQPVRLVLVFDQFEELFAIGQASEETRGRAARFLTELADLIENRAPEALERRLEESPELVKQFVFADRDYRVLVSLREDYLPHLESLRPSMPSITENRMRLTRMNGTQALEAVTNSAGHLVAPEVARQVVRFVAGGRLPQASGADELARLEVEPSLLSLVCRELNNRRLALGLPQITADLLAGNREGILQDFYERCVADQPPAVRAFVEDELVTDSGLRENLALERARKTLTQHGAPASAIDELVKRRLLHIEERLDIQRVELTHDVLTSVVKKSRDERQQKEARLRAEQQAQEVREKARRQRRRLRLIVAGMAVALAVVTGFGAVSFYLYRVSEERFLEAERQKERADRSFDEARGTVDELLTEMSQEGLKDVPGLQELRRRFAEKAVQRYEGYLARRPDDSAVTDGHARSLTALGAILGQVGSLDKAVATLEKAVQIRESLVAEHPNDLEYQYHLALGRFELGYLYWSLEQMQPAQPHLKRAARELEAVVAGEPARPQYRLALARTHNSLGNVVFDDDRAEARRHYELARTLAQALCDQFPDDPKYLEQLMPPIGNLARLTRMEGKYAQALELVDRFLELVEAGLKRAPNSPHLLGNRGIGYDSKARLLRQLRRPDEALNCCRASVASFRSAARENPLVGRFQWLLAGELRQLASDLSDRRQYAEAKDLYEEACGILDALTQRVDDRATYGAALIESWVKLASFHQGTKGDKADQVAQKQGQLRCLDQAVQHGRKLSKKHPNDPELNFQFADALNRRALFDSDGERNREAYPFYQECLEVFRTRVCARGYKPTSYELGEFLKWAESAKTCARNLKRSDEVIRLAQVAYDLGKDCKASEGIQSLGWILTGLAKVHEEAGRHREAVEAYSRSLRICRPAFEKAPWHWYLRSVVSDQYKNMALCHEKLGEFHQEVLAWREHLKVWLGPMQGMKIDDHVDPARPTNEAEALRLRQFVKSAPPPLTITVSCDFSGVRYPFDVHITNVPWPKDPLEDQARWLKEERGGTIPEEFRETFRNWHKLAYQRNLSFVGVCNAATRSFSEAQKAELDRTTKKHAATIATLTDKLKLGPKDADTQAALAAAYERLAETRLQRRETREAIAAYEQSLLLLETVTRRPSPAAQLLEQLGNVYFKLGELYSYASIREYGKAYAMFQHHQEVFERLSLGKDGQPRWRAATLRGWRALGGLCGIAFSPADGAVWYLKAMEQDDSEAAEGLASLYLEHPEVAAAVPEPTRQLLLQVAEKTAKDPRTFPRSFAQATKDPAAPKRKLQRARLEESARQFHDLAEVYAAKGRRDDYRKVLTSEHDLRAQLVRMNPASWELKVAQADVAAQIARSHLEADEKEAAVEWTTRAADLSHVPSLLQLSEWYEKGTLVKRDAKKAKHYSYVGLTMRGARSYNAGRFKEALADLLKASESEEAQADAHERVGMSYGKLGRWDEAITAYRRSIELDPKRPGATGVVLNLLEALVVAERPEQVLQFLEAIQKKGWEPPREGEEAARDNAFVHGFQAMALRMTGQDGSEAEHRMRQFTGKPGFKVTGWSWDELDQWLKTTRLAPERKAAVERIIAELKGTAKQ